MSCIVKKVYFSACILLSSAFAFGEKQQIPKYVFLFIGDGMGLSHVSSSEIYAHVLKNKENILFNKSLTFTNFPVLGNVTTHASDSYIPDSASAGTAIATGKKTADGIIAMNEKKQEKYTSIAKLAMQKGMKIGIVTSVSIEHATPAVFYANVPSRKMMYDIALQIGTSNFNYFAGGGITDPDGKKTKISNPINAYKFIENNGYQVVKTTANFNKLKNGDDKVLAVAERLTDAESMPYEIDREAKDISLADFTQKGIELLDNKQGFFMMVEGGKIDWSAHANDFKTTAYDVFAFDKAVQQAVYFAEKHPTETLILVTADHETGGLAIGNAISKYTTNFKLFAKQRGSFKLFDNKLEKFVKNKENFDNVLPLVKDYFGFDTIDNKNSLYLKDEELNALKLSWQETIKDKKATDESSYLIYGDSANYFPLTEVSLHLLAKKSGIGWTTFKHTGSPVPVYAQGVGQDEFKGFYDNTDIFNKLVKLMELNK